MAGDLIKSEYEGKADDKYSKKLKDFKIGFKAISAKEFKALTNSGTNFRMTMVELTSKQTQKLDEEIEKRMKLVHS